MQDFRVQEFQLSYVALMDEALSVISWVNWERYLTTQLGQCKPPTHSQLFCLAQSLRPTSCPQFIKVHNEGKAREGGDEQII